MLWGAFRNRRETDHDADGERPPPMSPLSRIEMVTNAFASAADADGEVREAQPVTRLRVVGKGTVADRLPGPGRGRQSGFRPAPPSDSE